MRILMPVRSYVLALLMLQTERYRFRAIEVACSDGCKVRSGAGRHARAAAAEALRTAPQPRLPGTSERKTRDACSHTEGIEHGRHGMQLDPSAGTATESPCRT